MADSTRRVREPGRLTRRDFLERGGRLAAGVVAAPLTLQLAACADRAVGVGQRNEYAGPGVFQDAGEPRPDAGPLAGTGGGEAPGVDAGAAPLAPGAVLLGLYPGDGAEALSRAVASLDFSWLGAGETVLVKVAANSGNPHPAVTSAAGVRAMVAQLRARGAGRVIVADQSGVEWVRSTATGRFGSTRANFTSNGLMEAAADAEPVFFDDAAWDSGYFPATLPDGHHWPRGLRLASTILEADHIVYMPRMGAHVLAGVTLAQKSAIGWLRDDSRHDLHNDAQDFYEKYAEISYAQEIRERFRLVVTVSENVLLHGGPDAGTSYAMSPPLVLASDSLANHDAVACSLLVTLQQRGDSMALGMVYDPGTAPLFNSFFAAGTGVGGTGEAAGPWQSGSPNTSYVAHPFEARVSGDRAVARGWALSGGKPTSLEVRLAGEPLAEDLRTGLDRHGEGLYRLS